MACGLGEGGIELPIFRLLDNWLYLLSQSELNVYDHLFVGKKQKLESVHCSILT